MSDIAESRGVEFDIQHLSWLLGAPIVPMVGHKGRGTNALLEAIVDLVSQSEARTPTRVTYGREIEEELATIEAAVTQDPTNLGDYTPRWIAIKLLEGDDQVRQMVSDPATLEAVDRSVAHLETVFGENPETVMADRRYGFISGACQEAVRTSVEARHTMSDKIDAVLTNRVAGLPIFLVLMYAVFQLTFALGALPMQWLELGFGAASNAIIAWWPWESGFAIQSLLVDGIIAGVGGVITFLPNILLLFLAIAILEDSGYMARAAFIMDHLMHKIGLHGKSFIPMVLGFGCSVPAIMATRILENRRDRLTTMMVVPLMSCGARLPIYALIIPTFFPTQIRAPLLWMIYLIGVVLAVAAAKLLRGTIFKGETSPLVMELPLYRMPTVKGVIIHMWERGREYVKKAGTIILVFSIIMWALTSYPSKPGLDPAYELKQELVTAGHISHARDLFGDSDNRVLLPLVERELVNNAMAHGPAGATPREEQNLNIPVVEATRLPEERERIRRFTAARSAIEEARKGYRRTMRQGEFEESSPEFAILRDGLRLRLYELREADPESFDAALTYLDEIVTPHREEIQDLMDAKRSEELAFSAAGRIGGSLEPAIQYMGFDWRLGTAMVGAFAAKELFVAQIGIVFAVGSTDETTHRLREKLAGAYTPLVGFCVMLFMLISMPCMATLAITRKESGSWKWALLQVGGLTALAFLLTTAVFQIGTVLGLGT
jgi:ferrous iron transport protein B